MNKGWRPWDQHLGLRPFLQKKESVRENAVRPEAPFGLPLRKIGFVSSLMFHRPATYSLLVSRGMGKTQNQRGLACDIDRAKPL